jgi:hypothetical protein
VELLGPMATTALQGIAPRRIADAKGSRAYRRFQVDSCYSFASEREVVARLLPHPYEAKATPGSEDL